MSALDRQAGGAHYKDFAIQPIEYCQKNGLGYAESNVIKYVSRHGAKGKHKDIDKAIHMLQVLRELAYPDAPEAEIVGVTPVADSDGWISWTDAELAAGTAPALPNGTRVVPHLRGHSRDYSTPRLVRDWHWGKLPSCPDNDIIAYKIVT